MLFLILIGFFLISLALSTMLKRRFREYSNIPTSSGLSGAEIAQKMLNDYGVRDVHITSQPVMLTDHYNPGSRTINLSEEVYHGRHVAAAAVAAHETGHAIQHAESYAFLQMRSAMVPAVMLGTKAINFVFIASFLGFFAFSWYAMDVMLYIIIASQAAITLFSLVTLPVEFDASNRALNWLERANVTVGTEHSKAKSALTWAASTYVVSAIAAVTTLLYYLSMLTGRD